MEVIVGTAGHIDHGKTALVKALTGIDADRLPEEKRRGITVDLGFAEMTTGDLHLGFVDVPGHERFVKNMLAGASGIDLVMLVIAADEGVMPQTREHFDICRLLAINAGVIVLTKTDLVDSDTVELAKLAAAELVSDSFLESAPIIGVSARTDDGIGTLKEAIRQIALNLPAHNDHLLTRLPIDRSFSMKGFGAVVTGTLASGEIVEGAEMELLPDVTKVRVRGLQTHGQAARTAGAGRRVAVNLGGIDHAKVTRGMVLVEPNVLHTTQMFDAEVEVLPDASRSLRTRQRVRVHIGTVEALARIQVLNEQEEIAAGGKGLAQIRLEAPVLAVPGERFIIRSYSPQATIAGGSVIDAFGEKHRRRDIHIVRQYLYDLLNVCVDIAATVRLLISAAGTSGLSFAEIQARTAFRSDLLSAAIDANVSAGSIVKADRRYLATVDFERLSRSAETAITDFHRRESLAKGMPRECLREKVFVFLPSEVFQSVILSLEASGKVIADKETIRLRSHERKLSASETAFNEKLRAIYQTAGLEVPKLGDVLSDAAKGTDLAPQNARKLFQMFLDSGEVLKVTDEFYFAKATIDGLVTSLRRFAVTNNERMIDVPTFKEVAGISRKYAIPLLEYLDREHITSRAGDKRLIH